jgi:putative DeoR family transcriptional regulator (stage III sporulation protein D)
MRDIIFDRSIEAGIYITEHKATIRQAANALGVSKSTVYLDVAKRLEKFNLALWDKVREVLDHNWRDRGKRGGAATRERYRNIDKTQMMM